MIKQLLLSLIVVVLIPGWTLHAQSNDCLSPRFFGGQYVRVTGSLDAGGLPFRDKLGLSEPVLGFIPLETLIISTHMERCVEGRNWYSVWYAATEGEEPDEVWVVDGDGQTYWLEPVPDCPLNDPRTRIFPSFMAYTEDLIVDSFDETTHVLRFSAQYRPYKGDSLERHYFTFDPDTGLITQTDYWYRDLITRELTNRLGITERVFGDGEDFSTIYVSPDRTKILYSTRKPLVSHCDHDCTTATLWIVDSDGSNPIALTDFYDEMIRQVVWGEDGKIYLSLSPLEVAEPDLIKTVCADGSCEMYDDELILEGRSLPFEYVEHMPMWSPNGQWIAATMGSEQLLVEGLFSTGVVIENDGNRYIQLPYNGRLSVPIVWLDDNTILYPVMGIGWDGKDYGLPSDFYAQDALWEIHLDFNALTYRIGDRLAQSVRSRKWYDDMWSYSGIESYHIIANRNKAIVYSSHALDIYCFSRG